MTQSTFNPDSAKRIPKTEDHDVYSKALSLPCNHLIHKYCLEECFRKKKNRCSQCEQIILPGYQAALLTKRLVNSDVLRQKEKFETSSKIMAGNYGAIGIGANLINYQQIQEDEEEEDILEETVDVDVNISFEESKEPPRMFDNSPININSMIAQYNAHQPDFGQKIDARQQEWIDPSEIMNAGSKRPFQIKNKTNIYRSTASGANVLNNRVKLEQDRRHMLQYNIGGQRPPSGHVHEEEKKVVVKKPPRGTSSNNRLRNKPKSLRSNKINYSSAHDNSMMNASSASNTSYNRANKSNRVTPP